MQKYPVPKRIVRFKGIFDYDGLYKMMQEWMKGRHYEFHEKKYKEKPYWFAPETEVTWWAEKKLTNYIMLRIDIFIHLYDAEKIEVVKDGKKKQMMNTRMQIDIWGSVKTDYSEEFEKSSFFKRIEKFLNERILHKEILLKYLDAFDYELYDFETAIKKFLGMEARESAY